MSKFTTNWTFTTSHFLTLKLSQTPCSSLPLSLCQWALKLSSEAGGVVREAGSEGLRTPCTDRRYGPATSLCCLKFISAANCCDATIRSVSSGFFSDNLKIFAHENLQLLSMFQQYYLIFSFPAQKAEGIPLEAIFIIFTLLKMF